MSKRVPRVPTTVLALALGVVVACTTVPLTGRTQVMLLPESTEQEMGVTAFRQALTKSKVSTDPALNAQLTRVGTRIAAATGRTDYQWEFKVFEDKQVNAFCLPGGKVVVYTGILPVTRDDAGLAAVVGHEVAHAIARHGGERVSQNYIAQFGLAGTQLALSGQDPLLAQGVITALGAGATVGYLLPYGRLQESEADHLGLIYMAKAGYHPSAARDLWVRMAEMSKGQQKPPEFLSTHPADAIRIRQIEAWLPEALKYYQPGS
jgi:predicted Zn-dependent protease